MLLYLAAVAATPPPVVRPTRPATARVRLVNAARATRADWRAAESLNKREIVVEEADGRKTIVRVIEHE